MKQRNFKIVSLLTVFTVVLNVLASLVLLTPASAAVTSVSASTAVVSAAVTFTVTGTGVLTMPAAFTVVTSGTNCAATGQSVNCTITGGTFTAVNPGTVGSYNLGPVAVPIVDSETVDVTGYINTSLTFDLDTASTTPIMVGGPANDGTGTGATVNMPTDCTKTACLGYGGSAAAGNYTVDLGNLVAGAANVSGGSALHAGNYGSGSLTGDINYISFDLSTNAAGGAIVTMGSANGALTRANGAPDAWDILSSSLTNPLNLTTIAAASGNAYGFKFTHVPAYVQKGASATDPVTTMQSIADCRASVATYCKLTTAAQTILSTGDSIQGLRATLGLAALANGTNPAGTYRDTLTFNAVGTF